MNQENKPDGFSYTYSAKQQEEVRKIREKYAKQEAPQDNMEKLRRLDAGVYQKATAFSLIFGILGSLLMGTGMSAVMTEFGDFLGDYATLIGICLGLFGMAMVIAAYPIYMYVVKRERARIAPEILRLTDELMKK